MTKNILRLSLLTACVIYTMTTSAAAGLPLPKSDELLLRSTIDESGSIDGLKPVAGKPPALLIVSGHDVLGKELRHLQELFGVGKIQKISSQDGSPIALCYSDSHVSIVFRAGAMGGWKRVTGVSVIASKYVPSSISCVQSTVLNKWLRTDGMKTLDPAALSIQVKEATLPPIGLIWVRDIYIDNKSASQSTALTYGPMEGGRLTWVDLSRFTER